MTGDEWRVIRALQTDLFRLAESVNRIANELSARIAALEERAQ